MALDRKWSKLEDKPGRRMALASKHVSSVSVSARGELPR